MKEITHNLDLKAEKLKAISWLLKQVNADDDKEPTSKMLKRLRAEIDKLILTDF